MANKVQFWVLYNLYNTGKKGCSVKTLANFPATIDSSSGDLFNELQKLQDDKLIELTTNFNTTYRITANGEREYRKLSRSSAYREVKLIIPEILLSQKIDHIEKLLFAIIIFLTSYSTIVNHNYPEFIILWLIIFIVSTLMFFYYFTTLVFTVTNSYTLNFTNWFFDTIYDYRDKVAHITITLAFIVLAPIAHKYWGITWGNIIWSYVLIVLAYIATHVKVVKLKIFKIIENEK